ncbi:MAG: DUF4845 domain-containing protein [Haliea sp.]|nr:DUF4845 domain-containing protein [Haliea sp.]
MKSHSRQTGMSIPGMLAIAIMVGFFVMCIIRMAPPYFEYLSVRDIIEQVVMEHDPETQSIGQIRRRIDNLFNTNQIYELHHKDVEVFRKDGKTFIDASYEVRIPVMGRIDAVLKFDDLMYVAGNPTPLTGLSAKPKKK